MYFHSKGEVVYKEAGVDIIKNICHRCHNRDRKLFYEFYSELDQHKIKYCLNCIGLGRVDSMTPLAGTETHRRKEKCDYVLNFELTDIQKEASKKVVSAVRERRHLLLHAVTGAGKTEIIFEGIKYAREHGLNVAVVSPRIDVVKEVHLRLGDAFRKSRIDLMFAGVKVKFEHHFTVCTVHQLYNFHDHFDCIIVDEYDAFPLADDKHLLGAIDKAKTADGNIIIMTATPTRKMVKHVGVGNIFQIARRYHGHDLTVPVIHYGNVNKEVQQKKLNGKLKRLLDGIMDANRRVLVFFPEIKMMYEAYPLILKHFEDAETVYSGDGERYSKVERMREGEIKILLTTTILERGVTFKDLDVIVVHTEYFPSDTLIQICGRAGRKPQDPTGNVHFITLYNTHHIQKTVRTIKAFNRGSAVI
ncbi:DEAD/DEAH box helicase family protein [Lacicoccus qingdaonensis]|uniref:Competence protein ComFA n=1 Tax=Lacicoccus qingdaonensis TaxID=576118 RepID=A0A1G9GCQ6_9BACL|nr:DEAD/DEAH box helicase family protein [Salinicoccus qingdaonensis]SDK98420.1 competence protein ComFA [Salinicoccus qingdaonensis]